MLGAASNRAASAESGGGAGGGGGWGGDSGGGGIVGGGAGEGRGPGGSWLTPASITLAALAAAVAWFLLTADWAAIAGADAGARRAAWVRLGMDLGFCGLGGFGLLAMVSRFRASERAARLELAERAEARRALLAAAPAGMYRARMYPDGSFMPLLISDEAKAICGLPKDATFSGVRMTDHPLIHPEQREWLRQKIIEHVRSGEPTRLEYRIVTPAGEVRWIRDSARAAREPDGSVIWSGVVLDITESVEAERRLAEQRRLIDAVARASPSLLYIYDLDRQETLYYNRPLESDLGYAPIESAAEGLRFLLEVMDPDDLARVPGYHARMREARDGQIAEFEYRMRARDGRWRWYVSYGVPYARGADGRVTQIVGTAIDVTAAREAERAFRESAERYRVLFENNPQPMWVYDRETLRFLAVNDAAVRAYGYSREEFLAMTIMDIRSPEEAARLRRELGASGAGPERSGGWRHRTREGREIEVEVWASDLEYQGRPGRLALAIDVTDRSRTIAALRVSEQRYRLASLATSDAIWDLDLSTDSLEWGDGAAEVFRLPNGSPMPDLADWTAMIHPEDRERTDSAFRRAIASGQHHWVGSYRFRRGDGTYAEMIDRAYVLRDGGGRPVRMIGAMTDVTARVQAERELRRTLETQRLLLSELDHRVKNAMTGLLTMIDLTAADSGSVAAFAEAMRRRVGAIVAVHSILSESRWSAAPLGDMIAMLTPPEVVSRVRSGGPPVAVPPRQATPLGMVVQELMANASKHGAFRSPGGAVDVSWAVAEGPDGTSLLRLTWRETGGPSPGERCPAGTGLRLVTGFARFELRGSVSWSFPPEGAVVEVTAVLDAREDPPGAGPA
ncbi:MAG: PAS domain S-box protein [Phycisphaerales bacterium]|nr:PAS domain S-box protein [Phycisphaerales bacterium]